MTSPRLAAIVAAALWLTPLDARAADLLPADRPIEAVIDHYIDAALKEANVQPAPQADDATLIRRLTLDVVGRIPTVAETKAFVESKEPNKRVQLVERLMASPGFVRHQANEFDAMMAAGGKAGLRDYLLGAFADNRSWDRIFREVILPDESDPKQKGAGEFVRQRVKDLDKLTNEVSTTFFGVNISCAQCHDHPKVQDWKQDHFFGMKSFFSRTFEAGTFLGEREYGQVKFRTTAGQEKQAKLMFLTGAVVDDPNPREPSKDDEKKERERLEEFKKNKKAPPLPKFSARAKLVELVLQPGQREFFARAIVNRLWYRLHGHGFVMPLDQMHSENPASHPELLDWLARDLIDHGYDLRRLTRGLVLSQTYSRSSRWEAGDAPRKDYFAVALIRPMTPSQIAIALRLATLDPNAFPADMKADDFERKIEGIENSARGFARNIAQPDVDFQIGVNEALLFSNNEQVARDFLADGGDRLVGRLKGMKDPGEAVELAIRTILSRPATEEEKKALASYVKKRSDRPLDACQQVVWALLTSAEFRFNY